MYSLSFSQDSLKKKDLAEKSIYVEEIIVVGNKKTKDQIILRELTFKAGELYLLVDKVEDQNRRFPRKLKGSTGLIDPFDIPKTETEETKPPQGASKYDVRWPNDPVEW